jgi:hypothetical protein
MFSPRLRPRVTARGQAPTRHSHPRCKTGLAKSAESWDDQFTRLITPALPDVWGPPFTVAFSVSGFWALCVSSHSAASVHGSGQFVTLVSGVKRLNDPPSPRRERLRDRFARLSAAILADPAPPAAYGICASGFPVTARAPDTTAYASSFSMRKSSRLAPPASSCSSHLGFIPRPAQVCAAFLGLRYFGATGPRLSPATWPPALRCFPPAAAFPTRWILTSNPTFTVGDLKLLKCIHNSLVGQLRSANLMQADA